MALKKTIKFVTIINYILIATKLFSQSSDTIRIRKDLVDISLHTSYTEDKGTYSINGKSVDEKTFRLIAKKTDSIENIVDNNLCKYFIFLNPDNKIFEESYWCGEFYSGYYKSYFPNGNVKEEGYNTESCDSVFFPGQKIGRWRYYDKKGKLIEILNHTPKILRKHTLSEPNLPPCACIQKMLYKDKNCITIPPGKLKGITHYYSSAAIFDKESQIAKGENDSLYELRFLQEYSSQFMDSVFSRQECINNGVFAIKIYKHNPKDTLLEFAISYIKHPDQLVFVKRHNYITVNGRKVLVKFIHELKGDRLSNTLPTLKTDEDFSKYFIPPSFNKPYTGTYKLHGNRIEATFSPPYFIFIPVEEKIDSD